MLKLTGDLSDTFIDLMTAWLESSGDSRLVATGEELFRSLLDLPEAATPETGASKSWFASMAPPAWEAAGDEGKGGGRGTHDESANNAADVVQAIGLLTAFTRSDLDL